MKNKRTNYLHLSSSHVAFDPLFVRHSSEDGRQIMTLWLPSIRTLMQLSDLYTQKSVGRKVLQPTMFLPFPAIFKFCRTKNLKIALLYSTMTAFFLSLPLQYVGDLFDEKTPMTIMDAYPTIVKINKKVADLGKSSKFSEKCQNTKK